MKVVVKTVDSAVPGIYQANNNSPGWTSFSGHIGDRTKVKTNVSSPKKWRDNGDGVVCLIQNDIRKGEFSFCLLFNLITLNTWTTHRIPRPKLIWLRSGSDLDQISLDVVIGAEWATTPSSRVSTTPTSTTITTTISWCREEDLLWAVSGDL